MKKRALSFGLITTIISMVQNVLTSNNTLTFGLLNGHPDEIDAMNFFANHTNDANNVTVIFKNFNIPEKINPFNQASELLEQNVVALIEGSRTKISACAFSEVTGIPLIRLHGDSHLLEQCDKVIQMSPGYRDYAHATLDILNKFGWKNVVLVTDDGHWTEAGYFLSISKRSEMSVTIVQLTRQGQNEDPSTPIWKAMDQVESLYAEVILLYADKENIELMLQQKSCENRNKWILQGQIPLSLGCDNGNTVLAFKLPYIESSATETLERFVPTNDTNKDLAALAYDAAHVITMAVSKEPCSSSMNGSAIKSAMTACMKKVKLDGLTGPVQFSENGTRRKIELDVLNLRNNSFIKIGTWNSTKGAVLSEHILPNVDDQSSRSSLQGKKLKVVVVEDAPFIMKHNHDHEDENESDEYEGYCVDLLNELAKSLKFTYDIYSVPDGLYGADTGNNTWNGLMGELVKKRADIVAAALTVTESREKVVDFSVPYMYYTKDILMKKASFSHSPMDLLQFMHPFHHGVWIATLASLITISIAVFVVNYYSPYEDKHDNGKDKTKEISFYNSVWFAVSSMLQQGVDNTPRNLPGRILAGSYWFCVLILMSTYTANLAAFLTVKNVQQPINNLEEIAESSYHVAVLESSSSHEFLKTTGYAPYKKIANRIEEEGTLVKSTDEAIRLVREKDEYVFVTDGPIIRYIANQKPCDLTTVPGLTTAKGLALAFQANDPHANDFTLAILHLHENNFLNSLERKWWKTKSNCQQQQEKMLSRKRIDLLSMMGVYVVLGVGIVMAFLTLIVEILWDRRSKQKLFKKPPRPKNSSPKNG